MSHAEQPKITKIVGIPTPEDFVGAFIEVDFEVGTLEKTDEELDALLSAKLVESYGYKEKP